jgi:hypothetical protein
MTNQKVNIEVQDFEDKKSQNGKRYTRFKTNDGWMSAFEKDIIDSLKKNEGKTVCVEIAVDDEKGFKNIRKFIGAASNDVVQKKTTDSPQEMKGSYPISHGKDTTTMYVSYSKDIFVQLVQLECIKPIDQKRPYGDIMDEAIELVKLAKECFENGTDDNQQE